MAMAVRAPGLEVVAPCPLRWDQLTGNDRVRFCGHCQQNVYNVTSLTMDEAVSLIQRCEGRVCMRLQRRADGTVITRDCFHLVRRARQRLVGTALGVAVAAAGLWSGMSGVRKAMEALLVPPEPPRCPPPRLAEPQPEPEPGIPDWLRGGGYRGQGAGVRPRPSRARAPQPKPPAPALNKRPDEDLETMGLFFRP